MKTKDYAHEVLSQVKQSKDWLSRNFYGEWEQVYKYYKCDYDEVKNKETGKIDTEKIEIVMPDTWSIVRRQVARITAQIPNLKYKSRDASRADRVSRKLMSDWDRGGVQRVQKRHVTQAALFGWSVRNWWWESRAISRKKRVNPFNIDPAGPDMQEIMRQYGTNVEVLRAEGRQEEEILAELTAQYGRGKYLPISYEHTSYTGPKTEFLFVGDCFPEPEFQSLQSARFFAVRRRRNLDWLKNLGTLYPDLQPGIQAMVDRHPYGSPNTPADDDDQELRRRMMDVINRSADTFSTDERGLTPEYTIYERHTPGSQAKVCYVGEGGHWIGEIDYPHDLDGKIAFTELVLIDDLLTGIGDSHARIIRGLNMMHNRQTNTRMNLIHNILRPLAWTTNDELWENPELLKRHDGFRLVKTLGPNDLGIVGEQAAIAAAAAGLNEDTVLMRTMQAASGEHNMSAGANIDPQQGRTATGARLIAYNQDILTRDLYDAFTHTSLSADATMMYLLNRSELSDDQEFEAAKYNRNFSSQEPQPSQEYITVTVDDFQEDDYEVEAEAGSTLADDDEANVTKAQNLFGIAVANPMLFNLTKARDTLLIAFGKGRELEQWAAPPPPPAPPTEPPKVSLSLKFEALPILAQEKILKDLQLLPPDAVMGLPGQDEVMGEPPPEAPPAPGAPPVEPKAASMPRPPEPEPELEGGGALAATEGRNVA
jgi:hypothetical protein